MKSDDPSSTFGLLSRIRSGDHQAFSALFEKYQRKLSLFLYYQIGDQLQEQISVQDLLQETFLRAYRDFDRFEYQGPGSFMHWLSMIGNHVVADQGRLLNRKKRKATAILRLRSDTNPGGPEPVISLSPSRLFDGQERLEKLKKTLDSLPQDYRQIIVLAKIHGCLTGEIADQLGKSRQSVSLLLHRALKRFRELYDEENH